MIVLRITIYSILELYARSNMMWDTLYTILYFSLASRVVSRDGHRFFVKHGFVQIRNDGQPTWIVSRNEKPLFLKNERKNPKTNDLKSLEKRQFFTERKKFPKKNKTIVGEKTHEIYNK